MKKQSHRSGYGVFILPINCTVNYFLKLLSVDSFFKDFQEPVFLFKIVEENWWFSYDFQLESHIIYKDEAVS